MNLGLIKKAYVHLVAMRDQATGDVDTDLLEYWVFAYTSLDRIDREAIREDSHFMLRQAMNDLDIAKARAWLIIWERMMRAEGLPAR